MKGIALIYGAVGGIGEATARLMAKAGRKLHLTSRDGAALEALARELNATHTVADLAQEGAFARVASEAAAAGGGEVASLVFAVGTINLKPFAKLTAADYLSDFTVNALWAAQAVAASLDALKAGEEGGSVVLFSTVAVAQGFSAHASIAMAKGAVEGLTLALAAELAPKVRVNCVAPSLTATPLAKALTGNAQMAAAIASMHALGRLGEPADVAPMVALLASDHAAWITGQVVGVDGGRGTLRTKG